MEWFPGVPMSSLAKPGLSVEVMALPDVDRAWLAGLFEGEGSVHVHRQKGRTEASPRAQLITTDEDVARKFHALTGERASFYYYDGHPSTKPHWKPQYRWMLLGFNPVNDLFVLIGPWLGKRRTAKFEEVLREAPLRGHAQSRKTHCPRDHPYSPENTYVDKKGSRHCRQCQKMHGRASYERRKARIGGYNVTVCAHKEFFTRASIGRIGEMAEEGRSQEDVDPHSFVAELSIECTECGEKFGFKGVEGGYNFDNPTQAMDGVTIHLPLRTPAEMTMAGPLASLDVEGRQAARGFRMEVKASEEGVESALEDAVRQRTRGWLAAYREGLSDGLDDVEAQRHADKKMEEEFGGQA